MCNTNPLLMLGGDNPTERDHDITNPVAQEYQVHFKGAQRVHTTSTSHLQILGSHVPIMSSVKCMNTFTMKVYLHHTEGLA